MGIPYIFAAYCPTVLPSPHHAPIPLRTLGQTPAPATADHRELWAQHARRWNDTWSAALNSHRASMGLAPVTDAWILPDERPLSLELETFLETGEPPVYFGFGSMRAPQDLN
jgi:vancomycin aglycone glucosyltransferase